MDKGIKKNKEKEAKENPNQRHLGIN